MSLETERERKRAKRTREIEREAVQSSLGLPCQSKAALYVSQLLRFGVVGPCHFTHFRICFLMFFHNEKKHQKDAQNGSKMSSKMIKNIQTHRFEK